MHPALITIHAGAGLVALFAGAAALRRRAAFAWYFWSLVACIGFLAAVVAYDWSTLDGSTRALFAALVALGVVMLGRGAHARVLLDAAPGPPSARFAQHVGFTLVALFDAFLVIAVLDLGVPTWAVVAAGVVGAIAGHFAVRRVSPAAASRRSQRT